MRKKILKIVGKLALFASIGATAFVAGRVAAIFLDPVLEAGVLRIFGSGVPYFNVGTQPAFDNSLRIQQSSTTVNGVAPYTMVITTGGRVGVNLDAGTPAPTPRSGFDIGDGTGAYFALALSTFSSAQLAGATPARVGEVVYNVTQRLVCVATGTALGGFGNIASTSAVLSGDVAANRSPCY